MRFPASAVALAVCFVIGNCLAGETADLRVINVSGESVVYVVPDEVVVHFGVETFNSDLDKAKAANDEAGGRLVRAIKAIGIDARQIQIAALQIDLQYRSEHVWNGLEGYLARRQYAITLKDVKLFEPLIDAGLKNGANQLFGFEFRTTELRKYRDQARAAAIKAAKEKAVDLAGELQSDVGRPRTINEGLVSYYGGFASRWGGYGYQQASQNSVQFAPAEGGDQPDSLPLGQIGVRAQVSVTFDLKPRN